MPKELNIFYFGDAESKTSWSGVPYFLIKNLERRDIKLNKINLQPNPIFNVLYKLLFSFYFNRYFKYAGINKYYNFYRSRIYYFISKIKIYYYSKKYSCADYNLFLTLSSYKLSKIPYIIMGDQSYLETLLEEKAIYSNNSDYILNQERQIIENALALFCFNKHGVEFIKRNYLNKNIYYFAGGMKLESKELEENEIMKIKKESNTIVFIGSNYYNRGCDVLLNIFEEINKRYDNKYKLIIVGIKEKEITKRIQNVEIFEYLNRDDEVQNKTYIDILKNAKLFVMPMRSGPLPGVFLEANYYYTPVITTNIWEVEQYIENDINGKVIDKPEEGLFTNEITALLENEEKYLGLAKKSHKYNKENFSWDKSIDELLKIISVLNDKKNI